jgi:hypothetical protein
MAPLNLADTHTRFAVIHAEGGGVSISIPLGNDGLALVASLRLSLRFGLTKKFISGLSYRASGGLLASVPGGRASDLVHYALYEPGGIL